MLKFFYIMYGAVVLLASTVMNLGSMHDSGTSSSNWNNHSNSTSYGGSGGSTGGFSSGGSHK